MIDGPRPVMLMGPVSRTGESTVFRLVILGPSRFQAAPQPRVSGHSSACAAAITCARWLTGR